MAIPINELRIGSKVLFAPQGRRHHTIKPRNCTVRELGEVRCLVDDNGLPLSLDYHTEDIQPIPLSPEVLKSCGFYIDSDGMWKIPFHECGLYWLETKMQLTLGGMPMINFDYTTLHQLQNLYFALSGKELTYNKP